MTNSSIQGKKFSYPTFFGLFLKHQSAKTTFMKFLNKNIMS